MTLTRRQSLIAAAALPGAALLPAAARADAHGGAAPAPVHRTFTLGEMQVTTLLAGSRPVEDPHGIFGTNVDDATFEEVATANFLPTDMAQFYFTPTVVRTGDDVILFDTGLNASGITAALAAAGYAPDDITHVVLTHMHGDHIGGLTDDDGTPTFATAAYITGQVEFDHWAGAENEGFEAKVRPLAEQFYFMGANEQIAPGITSVAAFGHTPGHMGYRLESGGAQIILAADMTNHYVLSLSRPDWEVRFDMDKEAAAATRRRLLGEIAADRIAMVGYHMPFPGLGFVEAGDADGDAFRWVPHSYQFG